MVAIVAEMTGYPPELLDLDLDLEADLGVDTVKQAEVFAAVRGRFGVERDDTLSLRDFPTLRPRDRLGPRQDRRPSRTADPRTAATRRSRDRAPALATRVHRRPRRPRARGVPPTTRSPRPWSRSSRR